MFLTLEDKILKVLGYCEGTYREIRQTSQNIKSIFKGILYSMEFIILKIKT